MKTKHILIAILMLLWTGFQSNVQAQEATQQALIVKKTATWCSNCGSWGWTWFKDLIAATADSGGINIALHSTSSLLKPPNDLDGDWLNSFSTIGGFPTFYVNGTHYTSYNGVLGAAKAAVAQDPFAGISVVTGFLNDTIYAEGIVTWQEAGAGEFQVGFYVIQDSLVHQQSAQGSNAIHRNVLREAMQDSHFGMPVNLSFAAGETLTWNSKHYYPGITVDKHHILAILWKTVGGKYQYVNGWIAPLTEGLISSTDRAFIWSDLQVFPNPVQRGASLNVTIPEMGSEISYRLHNYSGQPLVSGKTSESTFRIAIPESLPSGLLLLELNRNGQSKIIPVQILD